MKQMIVLLCVAVLSLSVEAIKYSDCGSSKGTVTSVQITGCENEDVCPLKRGTKPTITIAFQTKEDSTALTAVVHGVLAGVPMPFPLPQPDACKDSGVTCPIANGSSYTYSQSLPVRNSYPPLEVKVKWELKDSSGVDVVCVLVPSKVV